MCFVLALPVPCVLTLLHLSINLDHVFVLEQLNSMIMSTVDTAMLLVVRLVKEALMYQIDVLSVLMRLLLLSMGCVLALIQERVCWMMDIVVVAQVMKLLSLDLVWWIVKIVWVVLIV